MTHTLEMDEKRWNFVKNGSQRDIWEEEEISIIWREILNKLWKDIMPNMAGALYHEILEAGVTEPGSEVKKEENIHVNGSLKRKKNVVRTIKTMMKKMGWKTEKVNKWAKIEYSELGILARALASTRVIMSDVDIAMYIINSYRFILGNNTDIDGFEEIYDVVE